MFAFSSKESELTHCFTIPVGQGPLIALALNLTHVVTASAGAVSSTKKEKEFGDDPLVDKMALAPKTSLMHVWEIGFGY